MGKKILDSKLLYALLAIAIAIGLWFYVAITQNKDAEATIYNIPVVFLNEDLLEESGLMISEGATQTVSLTFMGARNLLADLNQNKDQLWVTVDVGRIAAAGDQRMAYDISFPNNNSRYSNGLSTIERSPNNVHFSVSRRIAKEIDVTGKFVGSLAPGYMSAEFEIRPDTIEISGEENVVNQVSHALVTITEDNLDATVSGDMGFTLISYQGEELTGLDLNYSTETVSVTMPVLQTADIPLSVEFISGGGVNLAEHVEYEIEPKTITVSGAKEDLEPLKEIMLGPVELANIIGSDTLTLTIPLAPELNNISGISEATVTVRIVGLETKILETDNIELINVPSGYNAESVTQSLQVLIRGPQDAIDLVFAHNLRVVADLTDVSTATGRYTVPAKIYLDGTSDVGVVGNEYKIVVSVDR